MNKRKRKKHIKKKQAQAHISEVMLDRDKNLTYVPHDESIVEVVNKQGVVDVFPDGKKKK